MADRVANSYVGNTVQCTGTLFEPKWPRNHNDGDGGGDGGDGGWLW